ncbi:MAG: AraC family transcriptional regulator [Bacteroidetes bacterium]|nr:AraC family transcriptional regulator [Fibrella sp.]
MPIFLTFYLVCVAIAIGNLLLTAILLVTLRQAGDSIANRILAGLLLCLGASFGSDWLGATDFFNRYPHVFEYDALLSLSIGPMLYFYIRLQTRPDQRLGAMDGLHVIPLLVYGVLLSDFLLSDAASKRTAITHAEGIPNYILAQYLKKGLMLSYGLACYRLLRRHNRVVEDVLSSPDNQRLTWIRHLLIAVGMLFAVWVASNEVSTQYVNVELLGVTLLGFSYWIAYQSLQQEPVFDRVATQDVLPIFEQEPDVRYRNSTLTPAAIDTSRQQIERHMAQAKPYLNPTLTLTNLADQLGMNPNHLSQVLNEGFGENFYRFINRYRIEESKRLLVDPAFAHYSILGIAGEAGFGAKSTFNKSFRELVGLSPSVFARQHGPAQPAIVPSPNEVKGGTEPSISN